MLLSFYIFLVKLCFLNEVYLRTNLLLLFYIMLEQTVFIAPHVPGTVISDTAQERLSDNVGLKFGRGSVWDTNSVKPHLLSGKALTSTKGVCSPPSAFRVLESIAGSMPPATVKKFDRSLLFPVHLSLLSAHNYPQLRTLTRGKDSRESDDGERGSTQVC